MRSAVGWRRTDVRSPVLHSALRILHSACVVLALSGATTLTEKVSVPKKEKAAEAPAKG